MSAPSTERNHIQYELEASSAAGESVRLAKEQQELRISTLKATLQDAVHR
jgi:hypothetical protein